MLADAIDRVGIMALSVHRAGKRFVDALPPFEAMGGVLRAADNAGCGSPFAGVHDYSRFGVVHSGRVRTILAQAIDSNAPDHAGTLRASDLPRLEGQSDEVAFLADDEAGHRARALELRGDLLHLVDSWRSARECLRANRGGIEPALIEQIEAAIDAPLDAVSEAVHRQHPSNPLKAGIDDDGFYRPAGFVLIGNESAPAEIKCRWVNLVMLIVIARTVGIDSLVEAAQELARLTMRTRRLATAAPLSATLVALEVGDNGGDRAASQFPEQQLNGTNREILAVYLEAYPARLRQADAHARLGKPRPVELDSFKSENIPKLVELGILIGERGRNGGHRLADAVAERLRSALSTRRE